MEANRSASKTLSIVLALVLFASVAALVPAVQAAPDSHPTVILQPVGQTVCDGAVANFSSSATGIPAPTVQWQVSTNGGSTFTDITGVESATSSSLSFTANASQDGYRYRAVFTNSSGTATSDPAILTVYATPVVTLNPQNLTVTEGDAASFTAAADGNPAPALQWQVSIDNGQTFTDLNGQTSSTLTFTASGSQNGYQYRAVFNNGCFSAMSAPATLTVRSKPVVTVEPVSQAVCEHSNATFSAAASGNPAPTVQWKVSTDQGLQFANMPGQTAPSLTFEVALPDNGNQYLAVFTNPYGSATSQPAALTVNTAPVVTTNPIDKTVSEGAPATFTAAATGRPVPSVQWQVSSNGLIWNNIPEATSPDYTFSPAPGDSGKQYRAVFINSCSAVPTTAAILTIGVAPVITGQPADNAVCEGASVTFTAAASGNPAPIVKWQVSANGTDFTDLPGATSPALTFTAALADSGKFYRAVFTNAAGSVTSEEAALTVNSAPVITANPTDRAVGAGSLVTLSAAATGSPAPTVQWQVSTNGFVWADIPGATSPDYAFTATLAESGQQYRAVFANSCSLTPTAAATLTVNAGPAITVQPANQTVCEGLPASFMAAASGSPAPAVQWQLSTSQGSTFDDIPGATWPTLTIITSQPDSGNLYRAVFTSVAGSSTSDAAILTVNTAAVVVDDPVDEKVEAGTQVTFSAEASGSPAPGVQWQDSSDGLIWTNIPGATSSSLTFTASLAQNGKRYRAVFTGSCNSVRTVSATLTVYSASRLPLIFNSAQ